jgi:putative FmdB family regulatory protein
MPLYEYECKKCHHRFEKIQKFSDPHMKKCPDCRGAVALVISAPAVQFKGSGWYVTDYPKKSSGSSSSSSDHESSKDSPSKDSASKDSASKDSASKDSDSRDSAKDSASKKDGKSKESKTESKSSTTKAEKN